MAKLRREAVPAIRGALDAAGGSITRAAEVLGVARSYLYVVAKGEGLDLHEESVQSRRRLANLPPD